VPIAPADTEVEQFGSTLRGYDVQEVDRLPPSVRADLTRSETGDGERARTRAGATPLRRTEREAGEPAGHRRAPEQHLPASGNGRPTGVVVHAAAAGDGPGAAAAGPAGWEAPR
jgi:hypothetical protein